MNNVWLKIKVWTKVVVFALVLLYVLLFVVNNSKDVTLWFWFGGGSEVKTSILKLVLVTFFLGVLVALMTRTILATVRQLRDLQARQRAERAERELADMKAKASLLRPREEEGKKVGSGEVGGRV